jgi:L-aminopeptidase/D-esterase-like protein
VAGAAPRESNESLRPQPRIVSGGRTLGLGMPSLRVGVAEYAEGPTGCTVFAFPRGSTAAVDVRGGAHATIFTEAYHAGGMAIDALCFAGGSAYGLEAATGVSSAIFAERGWSTDWLDIALVSGGIIFDYRPRQNALYPDKALGAAAYRAAQAGAFPLGARGAGVSASVGKALPAPFEREPGGQGAACLEREGTHIAVFTVVNAVGAIVGRDGAVVRGHREPASGVRMRAGDVLVARDAAPPPPGNTTLTLVVTDRQLRPHAQVQIARQVHASMSRAIEPFHTLSDGDVLWAVSTNEGPPADGEEAVLSIVASELAWDAVLSCFDP